MLKTAFLAALCCVVFSFNADARQRHHTATGLHPQCNVLFPCQAPSESSPQTRRETRGRYVARSLGFGGPIPQRAVRVPKARQEAMLRFAPSNEAAKINTAIVPHPEGCPSRAFCGCGAAVRIFGHSVRELWLAANWFKFPRTSPAPGMAAVRRHHVFVLEADLGGGLWQVFDANSGGHLTRVHARSLAGM